MSTRTRRVKRALVAVLGAALVGGSLVSTAAPASAATISVPFVCTTNYLGADFDNSQVPYNVTITAPESVDPGDPIVATYDFGNVPVGLPFAITNAVVTTQGTVTGRKQTTGTPSVNASSPTTPSVAVGTIAPYATVAAAPVTVSIPSTAFAIGDKVEIVPGEFRVNLASSDQFGPNGAYTSCTPQSTAQYAARTLIFGPPPVSPVDRCVAYNGDVSGGPGCTTEQVVNLSITQGRLVQRTYTNTTPASGPGVVDGSAITTPVAGTPIVNSNPTTVNLGTLTSPLAPVNINGTMNDVTVTDNRGGTFGWSLSATLTDFTGSGGNTLSKAALKASPACSAATNATAWDYDAPGQTAIPGFDDTLIAPGIASGSSSQSFSGTVSLCTKDTAENLTSQTSGGVYTAVTPLQLTMPAFQAADRYAAVMTVLLV